MSNPTVKTLAEDVAALTEAVNVLAGVVQTQMQVAAPVEVKESKVKMPKDFDAKFNTQLERAKKLAAKNNEPSKLALVGDSVWYMGHKRKIPARGVLLATVNPNGSVVKAA